MRSSDGTFHLRTARSTYVMFTALFGTIVVLFTAGAIRHPDLWKIVALWAGILGALLLHFSILEVAVSNDTITHRTLAGRRSLPLADVARSDFRWDIGGRDPRPFLVITPASGGKALRINLKPFRREDIARLLAMPELKLKREDDVT